MFPTSFNTFQPISLTTILKSWPFAISKSLQNCNFLEMTDVPISTNSCFSKLQYFNSFPETHITSILSRRGEYFLVMTNVFYVIGLNCKACIVGLNYSLLLSLFFNRPGTRCSGGICRDFTYFTFVVTCSSGLKYTLVKLHSPLCSIIDLVLDIQEKCAEALLTLLLFVYNFGLNYTAYLFGLTSQLILY